MAYDLEEQEQLASIKAFWSKYGNLLTWVLIVALAAYAAWSGWHIYQSRQAQQASQLYEEQQKAVQANDGAKVLRAATDIQDKFGSTAYAQMSGLVAAKQAFQANDGDGAKKQLQWVIDHGRDAEYRAIAAIRLAGILLDAKAYDDALKLLSGDFPVQFAGAVADRKADILVAQNKLEEARKAYQTALDKTDERNPARQLIQLKLDAIGGAAVSAAG
ncbi:putative negative regulator of RcsB-dependent stress response [Herbaspirillum sp. Sphag1AN]|uniref:YfgM family protein n=1 Tax=unclassified Herbaspirillum TaxID=2624150 RepID=UPI00161E2D8C|nr:MULTISPECIES: tetratricopeptide repeat protein [unclassified Herbaspirillum]MBB3210905.1 putative negative regulator of RcsB-dependent stress response [Herbaspirillum sp. Sphag1AN]MBB3244535.1 putative negative regulator of RcsB-dependent stress response [Herbaspirillum sp. Sphag64]